MYSIRLICAPQECEFVIAELWEAGTAGIHEVEEDGRSVLLAGFETNVERSALLTRFANYSPAWEQEDAVDWVAQVHESWPVRFIGERIFLAPAWSEEPTPPGRIRVVHNPGLACGTGEHPCTRMAMIALERCVRPEYIVADVGTGSAVLAIVARRLGARSVIAVDPDEVALCAAKENFRLNGEDAALAAGSADCLADDGTDVTVANISGTVLLSILDELIRITRNSGWLILTGFPEAEAAVFEQAFAGAETFREGEWCCLLLKVSKPVCV